MLKTRNTSIVKSTAQKLGFDFCGISEAGFLEEDAPRLEKWLKAGHHGKMAYMENHFEKRLDPTKLVPGAKSVVSLLYNHFPQEDLNHRNPSNFKIAKYAYGKDYHFVIKDKLKAFMKILTEEIGEVNGRVFVDSAPVMERSWAAKSGLGWVGKHTLLINKQQGSYFFLAELIIDLELTPDAPIKDYCGTCTRCVDACPTDALTPYQLDANKCISYLTIELKDQIPGEFEGKMQDWIFGCDICQDVCPWNRFSKPHREPLFEPNEKLTQMTKEDWQEITAEVFKGIFKGSAAQRTQFKGLQRNIKMAGK